MELVGALQRIEMRKVFKEFSTICLKTVGKLIGFLQEKSGIPLFNSVFHKF